MNVCILSSVHEALDTRIFYKEAKTLVKAGYDVSLIAQHDKEETIENIEIIALPKPKNRFERFFKTNYLLFKKAVKQRADVYHFHDPELMPIGLVLKLCTDAKLIYDAHEDTSRDILAKKWINSVVLRKFISIIFEKFEKISCLAFDKIITISAPIAQRFPNYKTLVIQNLPILKLIKDAVPIKIKKTKPIIIYSGGLNEVRGIKEIIQAVGLLRGEVKLWLLGDFKEKNFEEDCKKINGWQYTEYFGYKNQNELYGFLKSADIGIINFLPRPHNVYALPNKPFEYMACFLPVIMSNFPYWQSIFKDCVLYCAPNNPEDIAKKIKFLLDNPTETRKLKERGKNLILEKYNWENESKKLLYLYNDLSKR